MRGKPNARPERQKLDFVVRNTELRDAQGVWETILLANGHRVADPVACIDPPAVGEHLARFPEGQFVAVSREGGVEKVVGAGVTMRTVRSPSEPPLRWVEMIGSYGLAGHDPEGAWLYGVEIAVRPEYQGCGVGSALYKARLALVEDLGLEGWYAGGMLMGYHRHREAMSAPEYARRVISGELTDPTVTMQMHRGLKPSGVIEEYCLSPRAGNCAVLLVWRPTSRREKRRAARAALPQPEARRA